MFAIPGDRGWYDGLTAFARVFCSDFGGRYFAGWRTRQRRSYFALKLPGRGGSLHRTVSCSPISILRKSSTSGTSPTATCSLAIESSCAWLRPSGCARTSTASTVACSTRPICCTAGRIFARRGVQMKVFLAGDYHHYRRHEEISPPEPGAPVQKITAGGGGAFLHATHDEDVTDLEEERIASDEPRRRFALKATYPDVRKSRLMSRRNLLFVFHEPATLASCPRLLYLMTVWMVSATMIHPDPHSLVDALAITGARLESESQP